MPRFVITGLSRLAVRVARELAEVEGAEVTIVDDGGDQHLATAVGGVATVVDGAGDRPASLEAARLAGADALLALGDDDLDNLRTVACAAALDPDVPVVLRSFDAAVADQLELAPNVRRAYSVSGLAAPAVVAALLGGRAEQTLRLGRDEVPLLRAAVRAGGPLDGATPEEVQRRHAVAVVARGSERWAASTAGDAPLRAGEEVLFGGRMVPALTAALANDPLPVPPRAPTAGPAARGVVDDDEPVTLRVTSTLLPAAAIALVVLLVGGTVAFGAARDLSPLEALYFTVTTAWGDTAVAGSDAWQQGFGLLLMVAVGALVGVLFSHLAALATEERMSSRMHRRAARMQGHVVVAGLGTVGYRVVRLLRTLGVPVVALDREATSRFAAAAAVHGPVVSGDARLPEDLARAGIERASCILATTDDDLVNITACLQSRALNPGIRTIARIFDESLGGGAAGLGIDAAVSASRIAAPAFVGAALDDRAPRHVHLDGLHLVALRHTFAGALPDAPTLADWRAAGVHLVAADGTTAVVCGPAGAPPIDALLAT